MGDGIGQRHRRCNDHSDGGLSMSLTKMPNIPDPDGFYADLIAAHEGLEDAASHALNARLVLIMANHIGDRKVLAEALELAKEV